MSGPQAARDRSFEISPRELLLPQNRRYADPLGATESRGLQAAAVVKQNDFLKGYIVRLQNQLEEYLGAHAPLSEAREEDGASVQPWIGESAALSPLLEAYDRRIQEGDEKYERLSEQVSAMGGRFKQLQTENERLSANARQAHELLAQKIEELDKAQAAAGSGGDLVRDDRAALLESENRVLSQEVDALREEGVRQREQLAAASHRATTAEADLSAVRSATAEQRARDSHGDTAALDVRQQAAMRDQENIRLRMELQASAKEAKVLATELEECRTEVKRVMGESSEQRRAAEANETALQGERVRSRREEAEGGAALAAANTALAASKHENEERRARAAADEAFTTELRRQAEELERSLRDASTQLTESRAREETLKAQARRLEEAADEYQLSSDQAQALEKQARREIGRLSDKLREVLVEAQARSEETVASVRGKYRQQKTALEQQITSLQDQVACLEADKERLVRDRQSAESEAEKMARDGPGGNVGRLSREVEELSLKLKQATTERDNANHGHKAMELSARRQQAQWEQEHVQTNTQLEALGRRVKQLEEDLIMSQEAKSNLSLQVASLERREAEWGTAAEAKEREFEERMARFRSTCKGQIEEMQERVKAAEESEGGSKSELASLLDAHDQLQGKWRAASKEMATQSARAVEEARAANVRLERRCQELNEALVSALSDKAASVAHEEQQDRTVMRLRQLLEASEKRAQENKDQLADLVRREAEIMRQRKDAVLDLERKSAELERVERALSEWQGHAAAGPTAPRAVDA